MLLKPAIFAVLLLGVANALRNCDDCILITQCREALNLMNTYKAELTGTFIKKAQCGDMKVCCLDFSTSTEMAPGVKNKDRDEVVSQINKEDEIEHHPNVNLLPDECGTIHNDGIFGTKEAKMNEFPWLALIYKINIDGKSFVSCVGTVINDRYVLTAASCIKEEKMAGVRVGEYNISSIIDCAGVNSSRMCQSNLQDVGVSETIMHPHYIRKPISLNNIGLIRLKKPLNLTVANAGATCLPLQRSLRDMDISGGMGVIAGWTVTKYQTIFDILTKEYVPIYNTDTCKRLYSRSKSSKSGIDRFNGTFCAGEFQHASCSNSLGGPLMLEAPHKNENFKLITFGITSYGPAQCGSRLPGVYTDVKNYMKWILDTIRP